MFLILPLNTDYINMVVNYIRSFFMTRKKSKNRLQTNVNTHMC